MHSKKKLYKKIILNALKEDIGTGDVTTSGIISKDQILKAKLVAKENGILSGIKISKYVFSLLDDKLKFKIKISDGVAFSKGDILADIELNGRALLSGERVMLNLLQRMCGIATLTNKFVQEVEGTRAKILDTRKTAPGLRLFDKLAVKQGGGENHRFGLFDMALIKDNHITAAGGITGAVKKIRKKVKNLPIEVEVKNIQELEETLQLSIDRIMLDNMNIAEIGKCVQITDGKIPLEVSGNVNLKNVREIALTGVDYISIGMLTHSVNATDVSLLVD